MTAKAAAEVAAVLDAYDFGGFATIADIGGGRGHLLSAVLDAAPTAEGVLFDLPEVAATLDVEHPRMTVQPGDFFTDPLPSADGYVLMEVLHDWADAECVQILSAVRRAAHDGCTLLVIEGVLAEPDTHARARTLDLVMLTVTGGRERTAGEMRALLERSGFRLDRVVDTARPMRVVDASPVRARPRRDAPARRPAPEPGSPDDGHRPPVAQLQPGRREGGQPEKRCSISWISGRPMRSVNSPNVGSEGRAETGVPSDFSVASSARMPAVAASSVPIG
jgi:O-methyltransferase